MNIAAFEAGGGIHPHKKKCKCGTEFEPRWLVHFGKWSTVCSNCVLRSLQQMMNENYDPIKAIETKDFDLALENAISAVQIMRLIVCTNLIKCQDVEQIFNALLAMRRKSAG